MLLLSGAAGIGSTSPVRQVKWDENSSGHSLAQPEPETLGIPGPKRPSGSLGNCRKAMGWKGAKAAVPAASPVPWELSCRPQATEGGSSGLPQHPEQTPACLMPPSASGFMSPPPAPPPRTLPPSVGPVPLTLQDTVPGRVQAPAGGARGAALPPTPNQASQRSGWGGNAILILNQTQIPHGTE